MSTEQLSTPPLLGGSRQDELPTVLVTITQIRPVAAEVYAHIACRRVYY